MSCWGALGGTGAVGERAGLGGSAASRSLGAPCLGTSGPRGRSDDVEEAGALVGLGARLSLHKLKAGRSGPAFKSYMDATVTMPQLARSVTPLGAMR